MKAAMLRDNEKKAKRVVPGAMNPAAKNSVRVLQATVAANALPTVAVGGASSLVVTEFAGVHAEDV